MAVKRDSYDSGSVYKATSQGIIASFDGEHSFLSNFYEDAFDCGGKMVPTAEHAFQAQKTADPLQRQLVLSMTTPGQAKRAGRKVDLRPNWLEVRVSIMRQILAYKFAAGTPLANKLISTYPKHLVEGNNWGDTFWGCVREPHSDGVLVGQNTLGVLLMERRDQLREAT